MDVTNALLESLAHNPWAACIFLFIAGAVSAFGPCGTQRSLGLVACTAQRKAASTVLFYAIGIVFATMLLLASTVLLRNILAASPYTNIFMAVFCTVLGITGLWRADSVGCSHRTQDTQMTALSALALGFGSSLIIAPCCTPFLLLIAAYAPQQFLVLDAAVYGMGAACPYIIAGVLARGFMLRTAKREFQQALRIISAALTLALGLLYSVEISI